MNKIKAFIIGVIIGSMLVGGVSYAADKIQIEVKFPAISYWLDGKKLPLGSGNKEGTFMNGSKEMPVAILYNGTTYVPLRLLGEALGKELEWDAQQHRVYFKSVEPVSFETVDPQRSTEEIQAWVERSKSKFMAQARTIGDHTYILVTSGEKNTGGYEVHIQSIKKYADSMVVTVQMTDPPKGAIVSEAITYPYTLVTIKDTAPGMVSFKETGGRSIPVLVGFSHLPAVHKETNNIILFTPDLKDGQLTLQGIVRSFEGLLVYSLIDEWGHVFETHSIQAAGAAPHWGYFQKQIDLTSIKSGMSMKLHMISPKNGSTEEMLTLDLDEFNR